MNRKRKTGLEKLAAKVSVVVPTAQGRENKIDRLVEALEKQILKPKELIVEFDKECWGRARNKGWKKAKGEIIWFLDDDMVPEPDALVEALKVFTEMQPDGVEGHIYGKINRINDWGYMSGHIFYTKKILEKVGGFDERFLYGWREDTDLAWRVLEAGGKIIYAPASRACHPDAPHTTVRQENEKLLESKHPAFYRKYIKRMP